MRGIFKLKRPSKLIISILFASIMLVGCQPKHVAYRGFQRMGDEAIMFDESQWGELNTHDPSIVKDGDTYYVFSTDASYGDIHKRGVQISDNNKEAHVALEIHLKDNKITGQRTGEYEIYNDYHIEMTIDGEIYDGVVIKQYDWEREEEVIAFTLMSEKGLAIWGSSKL